MSPLSKIAGVIFDLDGTLVDSALDFKLIRQDLGLGPEPILEQIEKLPMERRRECEAILSRHETAGAMRATLHSGAAEWIEHLDRRGIPRAIFTRNARSIVSLTLDRCGLHFDHIIAREDAPPKPDPTGIHRLCELWKTTSDSTLIIGDYLYDVLAGREAGIKTALVTHGRTWEFEHLADFVWPCLSTGLEIFQRQQNGSSRLA